MQTQLIHCYDFPSFAVELEKAIHQGFALDMNTISHYPQQIGFQYIATVVKQDSSVAQEVSEVKDPQENTTATPVPESTKKPAGRPAKAK